MADPIIGNTEKNRVKLATWGFSGLLITNSISEFENQHIQDGVSKMANRIIGNIELYRVINIELYRVVMATRVFPELLILDIRNWPNQDGGSKMTDQKLDDIELNRVEWATQGSSGSLIANLIAYFGNRSKFTICYLGSAILDWLIFKI